MVYIKMRKGAQKMIQETRRIQKTGGSTYTISLPKRWIKDVGLDKGDELILTVGSEGSLSVRPSSLKVSEKISREISVTPETNPRTLLRQLIGVYITGHDVIKIQSSTKLPLEIRRVVQDFARRVIGPEIIEESSTVIVVQDVADHTDLAMRKVVRRMHLMARNMFEEALRALRDSDASLAGEVIARDDEVDRLYWFVEKQHSTIGRNVSFATKMSISWLEADVMLSTAKSIERIADHASRIAHHVKLAKTVKADATAISEIEDLGSNAIKVFDESIEALFRKDSIAANECIEKSTKLQDKTSRFVEGMMSKRGKTAIYLAFAAESIDRACGYSSDIAETVINLAEGSP